MALGEINGRGFIDVTFAVPSGMRLDERSITDIGDEFTITAAGGTVKLDPSQRPVLVNAGTHTYRYFVVSKPTVAGGPLPTIAVGGIVSIGDANTPSGWALINGTTGDSTGGTGSLAFEAHLDESYVDVAARPDAEPDRRRDDGRGERLHDRRRCGHDGRDRSPNADAAARARTSSATT